MSMNPHVPPHKSLFAMVTTRASRGYTPHALRSFSAKTPFTDNDQFILIDNDGACDHDAKALLPPRGTIVGNNSPRGFAENMNYAISVALSSNSDLFFLNNDLIFTDQWLEPLRSIPHSLVSPLSNRELNYATPTFKTNVVMTLSDYLGREAELESIVKEHKKNISGGLRVVNAPFFAIRIPLEILHAIGNADESFGKGGGEDYDYCLRALLAGFSVTYARSSYILHFGGKSSYSGAESEHQQREREQKFMTRFQEKWGEKLFRLCLKEDLEVVTSKASCAACIQRGDYRGAVQELLSGEIPALNRAR